MNPLSHQSVCFKQWLPVKAAATVFCLATLVSSPIARLEAQYTRLDQVSRQVSQMRGELQYMAGELAKLKSDASGGNASQLQIRFSRLEQQFQQLTGKLEELDYRVRNSDRDDQRFRSQVVSRIEQAEARLGGVETATGLNTDAIAALPATLANGGARAVWSGALPADSIPTLSSGDGIEGAVGVELSSFPAGSTAADPAASAFDPYQVAVPADVSNPVDDVVFTEPDTADSSGSGVLTNTSYQAALDLFREGRLPEARAAFQTFLVDNDVAPLAGNASYWLGETHYSQGNYTKAAHRFSTGFAKYRDSAKAPDHLYKLALSLEKLARVEEACASLRLMERQFADARPQLLDKARARASSLSCPTS